MLQAYAADIAAQMGIMLTDITVVEGERVGCADVMLLHLGIKGFRSSSLVYQTDVVALQKGGECDRLETRIRSALQRLQLMVAP